jgi:CO/xanthine dehydrogenase FAD-binding subunit
MSNVLIPESMEELWRILEKHPGARVYAGGTDLLVKMRAGLEAQASCLVCLERITELGEVSEQGETVRIGACTTHTRLLADPVVSKQLPVLVQAVRVLGSVLIRNMGTIGGNVCTASPAGDTLPPLYVLGAELELSSRTGTRCVAIGDFIKGPGQTALGEGEILTAVRVRKPREYNVFHYEKVGQRKGLCCSAVSLAAMLGVSSGGVVERAALAWGSVGPTIVRSGEVERMLVGANLSPGRLREVAAEVGKIVSPISDVRANEAYRRTVAGNLLLRLIPQDRPSV